MKHFFLYLMISVSFVSCKREIDSKTAVKKEVIKYNNSLLAIDSEKYSFGTVEEGDIVTHVFTLYNRSQDTLRILNVKPSCGCTAALLSKSVVGPNDTTGLKVVFNTSNKGEGIVQKVIRLQTNSLKDSSKFIYFDARIVMKRFPHKNEKMTLTNIFSGDCATCHVNRGKGRYGKDLLNADCMICHGEKMDNKPAVALSYGKLSHLYNDTTIFRIIADGILKRRMPSFLDRNGGPLSETEIKSLIDYLKSVENSENVSALTN